MALVRFLLVLLVIYFIGRIFSRFILRSYVKNMKRNFENQNTQYSNKKEGDVTINPNSKNDKKFNKGEGDYVDYEEIKE